MPVEIDTTNNSFRVPTSRNDGSDFATGLDDFATDVDAMWLQGTITDLPAASKRGRRYYATDTAECVATPVTEPPVGSVRGARPNDRGAISTSHVPVHVEHELHDALNAGSDYGDRDAGQWDAPRPVSGAMLQHRGKQCGDLLGLKPDGGSRLRRHYTRAADAIRRDQQHQHAGPLFLPDGTRGLQLRDLGERRRDHRTGGGLLQPGDRAGGAAGRERWRQLLLRD